MQERVGQPSSSLSSRERVLCPVVSSSLVSEQTQPSRRQRIEQDLVYHRYQLQQYFNVCLCCLSTLVFSGFTSWPLPLPRPLDLQSSPQQAPRTKKPFKRTNLLAWYRVARGKKGRDGGRQKYRMFGAPLNTIMINGQLPEILQVCTNTCLYMLTFQHLSYWAK